MATEHFCLRWNNHQSTLVSVFDNLLESGTLVDCTLAADGRYLKAHKVVLSACSPYLGMLLSQHYDKHPIIILKDVKFEELKAMLDYMYRGEVNISQEQLSTFLKAAETLQIKGLTDAGSDEGNGLQPNRPPSSNSTTSANEDPQSPGPPGEGGSSPCPRKRRRNKHGDDGEGDSASKVSLSEGSDRLSGTSVGSPVAKSASVKREPADGEGDGQLSVDDSGEVVMMSRPGPSNGGTNNKAPWILSADSSGEEMQLTPGQDGRSRRLKMKHHKPSMNHEVKQEVEDSGSGPGLKEEELKKEIKQELHPLDKKINSWEKENSSNQNRELVYAMARNEDELIIPDPLEEPNLVVGHLSQNYYQPSAKSVFTTTQRGEDKSERRNGGSQHFISQELAQGVPPSVNQSSAERSTKEESLNRVHDCLKNKRVGIDPKPLYTSLSKSPSSVTVNFGNNSHTQLTRSSQMCLRSSSHYSPPLKCSKTVVDVADAFDKKNVKVKKTKLEFQRKYRKILPASEDSSCSLTKGLQRFEENKQPAMPSHIGKQSTNPSSSQCPTSPSKISGNVVETSPCVQQNTFNHQQTQGALMTNTSLTPSVLSIPQQIQVGQIRNPNPSLFSIPQQFQGSQIVNNTPNVLSIPQQVPSSQMNNSGTAVLSIAPQFSMSPIQSGDIRMQFSNNTNLQTGNFQNAQFFTNTNLSQSQVRSNQNGVLTHQAQAISHPVFVASNIISSCQTSNQFLPSTSVHYNFSTAQPSVQPNFSVPTSQHGNQASQPSIVPSTPSSRALTQPSPEHSVYVRTPCGFVRTRLPSEGNQAQNTQFVTGKTTFSPFLQGRGPSSQQGRGPSQQGRGRLPPPQQSLLLPKPKTILPKRRRN